MGILLAALATILIALVPATAEEVKTTVQMTAVEKVTPAKATTGPKEQTVNSWITNPDAFDKLMAGLCRERGEGYEYAGKRRLCVNYWSGD